MTLTDDDLGARLRSALQTVTPLATDPVPPPRFADGYQAGADTDDVLDLGTVTRAEPPRRSRRRWVVAGTLVAAAVAAGLLIATTGLDRELDPVTPPGGSAPVPTVSGVSTRPGVPPTGPGDGWFAYPELVRCEAPTGSVLAARHTTSPDHSDIWTVSAAATCRTMPLEHGRYAFDPPRARNAADTPAHIEGTSACLMASTRPVPSAASFVSHGNGDYLEFFGPSCLIRSAAR